MVDFIGDKDAFSLVAVAKTGRQVLPSIKIMLTENERVKQYGFVQTELDRAVKNVLSRVENEYNERDKTKSADLVQELVDHYLKGEAVPGIAMEYELYKKWLPAVSLADVNSLIDQWIRPTDRSVVITAPAKEAKVLPVQSVILAELNRVPVKLKKYTDKIIAGTLLPVEPVAGSIVTEKNYTEIGTKEWTLSNGARVVLKPTDFKNDDIQFSAISWGGTSVYPDSDYVNAINASSIVSVGGMGNLDMQSLQKALAGKNCYVAPGITHYMQGLNGSSTPKDLPTAMQLLHGYFVAPRKDTAMFSVVQEQIKVQLANKENDPGSVFGDSVSYIMGNYHFRRKPFDMGDLKKMNLDRSMAIFKDRFRNAGQFLFTFVGNFNTDSIKPLVEKYIASLPGTTSRETWKDVGIRYPSGNISKVIRKGKENKASVRLYFTGAAVYGEMDELQLGQLCKAMAIKLRETLREDAGGVYGVGVNGGLTREPVPSYSIAIQFGCAPENVEKLTGIVMDEIRNTKANGVAAVNIEKTVAEQTRALENEVKENSYWRFRLEQQFFRNADPLSILEAPERIKRLTVEKTKELADKYFNEANMAKFVLLPGK